MDKQILLEQFIGKSALKRKIQPFLKADAQYPLLKPLIFSCFNFLLVSELLVGGIVGS